MRVPISLIARIACWPVWNTKTPIAFLGTNLMAEIMFSYILNAICDFFIANSKLVSFHRFPGILGNVYMRNSSSSQNERRERPPLITCISSLILFIASTISFLLRHKPPQKALTWNHGHAFAQDGLRWIPPCSTRCPCPFLSVEKKTATWYPRSLLGVLTKAVQNIQKQTNDQVSQYHAIGLKSLHRVCCWPSGHRRLDENTTQENKAREENLRSFTLTPACVPFLIKTPGILFGFVHFCHCLWSWVLEFELYLGRSSLF